MIGLSKYQEGQEISAYTKKDEIFEGYVKSRNGVKYVVDSNNKAIKLSELKLVKRVGRLIKEDIEQKIGDILGEYDLAAITDAHDEDKVSKALTDQLRALDSDAQKADSDELQSTIKSKIVGQSLEQEIEAGNIKQDDAIEKYKKENSDDDKKLGESLNLKGTAPEKLFNNKAIQENILKEMEVEFGRDAEYLQPTTDYGMGPDHREDAVEDCMDMIENGEPKEKIIDRLQTEFEIAKEEAENMYNDLSQDDLDWEDDDTTTEEQNDEYDLYGVTYSDISNDVDNEFEDELNTLSYDEIGFGNELVEHLARKFGGDAAKAIRESEDTQGAVLNLAEQVKMIKVNLIRSKNR
jgi:hypothetical protein